jgi:dTDP-4-amino-4,6-dideoxygalactose transaminase
MKAIAVNYGLEVIPFDICAQTATPKSVEVLESIITERTVCIIFAHLLNRIYSIEPYKAILQDNKIDVIEDLA